MNSEVGLELVVFVGLQGSGKSTFYRERLAGTHVLVSKDLMSTRSNRSRRQSELVRRALSSGKSIVVDNTNPTPADREPLVRLGKECGARVTGYFFRTPVKECVARNRQREGRSRVPDVAIFATLKRMQRPSYAEGFDRLYCVGLRSDSGVDVREWAHCAEEDDPRPRFRRSGPRSEAH